MQFRFWPAWSFSRRVVRRGALSKRTSIADILIFRKINSRSRPSRQNPQILEGHRVIEAASKLVYALWRTPSLRRVAEGAKTAEFAIKTGRRRASRSRLQGANERAGRAARLRRESSAVGARSSRYPPSCLSVVRKHPDEGNRHAHPAPRRRRADTVPTWRRVRASAPQSALALPGAAGLRGARENMRSALPFGAGPWLRGCDRVPDADLSANVRIALGAADPDGRFRRRQHRALAPSTRARGGSPHAVQAHPYRSGGRSVI